MRKGKEITESDIDEYLIAQSDFDLELFVDRSLRERGISTSHGGSYFDSITGKNRQFDVRAYAYIPPHCGIFLAIECKSLAKTFPLIVSRVPRPEADAYHELIRTWGRKDIGEEFQVAVESDERMPLYRVDQPVGKKTVQIGRDEGTSKDGTKQPITASDGETFDKWSQALSSAADLVHQTQELRGENGIGSFYSLILPILVVSDDSLWVVDYTDKGNSAPQRVSETTLFVDRAYKLVQGALKVTHLHIFTRAGFTDFLKELQSPSQLRERMFRFAVRQG
jgi:hypothetical protein